MPIVRGRRIIQRLCYSVIAALLAAIPMVRARADNSKFPDGAGKATFLKVCSQCHDIDPIASLRYSRDEWKDLVYNMKDMGADATDQECSVIIDYLYKSFPR